MKVKFSDIIRHLASFLFALVWVFPLMWLIVSAFKPGSELFKFPLTFFPRNFTLVNFIDAFKTFDLFTYTMNTLFITVTATILTVIMSSMCGYALAKYRYKWLNLLFICLLMTTMLPTEVIMNPSFTVLLKLGLYNSRWGCIIPTVGTMTGVFMMRQFFMGVPTELMEAARIDGANEGMIFARVMFPICKPQVAVLTIFSFRWRWNDYIWPLLSLSDPKKHTLQLALRTLSGAEAVNWSLILSTTVMTMIPILVVFLFFNKKIMNANMGAGVKG